MAISIGSTSPTSVSIAIPPPSPRFASGRADGRQAEVTFGELSALSSRFAHFLTAQGIAKGDRVGIMLEPSLFFYAALFGTLKRGAIAVPLFTLFGPEGVALRLDDCRPQMLLVEGDPERWQSLFPAVRVVAVDTEFEPAPRARKPAPHARHGAPTTLPSSSTRRGRRVRCRRLYATRTGRSSP